MPAVGPPTSSTTRARHCTSHRLRAPSSKSSAHGPEPPPGTACRRHCRRKRSWVTSRGQRRSWPKGPSPDAQPAGTRPSSIPDAGRCAVCHSPAHCPIRSHPVVSAVISRTTDSSWSGQNAARDNLPNALRTCPAGMGPSPSPQAQTSSVSCSSCSRSQPPAAGGARLQRQRPPLSQLPPRQLRGRTQRRCAHVHFSLLSSCTYGRFLLTVWISQGGEDVLCVYEVVMLLSHMMCSAVPGF